MKSSMQGRPAGGRRQRAAQLPLAVFHAPLPGEEVGLFSDRNEDAVEYEAILHEFESSRHADRAPVGDR
jgi:hypothetical protein